MKGADQELLAACLDSLAEVYVMGNMLFVDSVAKTTSEQLKYALSAENWADPDRKLSWQGIRNHIVTTLFINSEVRISASEESVEETKVETPKFPSPYILSTLFGLCHTVFSVASHSMANVFFLRFLLLTHIVCWPVSRKKCTIYFDGVV